MIAMFDSECWICDESIEEGIDEVTHSSEDGWVHVECLEAQYDEDDFAFGD